MQNIRDIATGRNKAYAVSITNNPQLNSQTASITVTSNLTDINGNIIPLATLAVGDTIYITDTNVPDRWVSSEIVTDLPSGYVPVSYIQGDGTAYLDLGTPLTDSDEIEITFEAAYSMSA